MIMPFYRATAGAAFVHRGPHRANRFLKADEQGLPDHEVADIEFGDFAQRGDPFRGRIVQAMTGMHFQARGAGERCAGDNALPFRLQPCRAWPSTTASHQAPVWISMTGARRRAAISIWAGSAAMNSDTRTPASFNREI